MRPLSRIALGGVRYYRDIPAAVRVLSLGVLINRVGGFVSTFLPLILAARCISARDIGAALVATGTFTVAGAWLGGMLTSRFGSRMVIVVALTGCALLTLGLIPRSPYLVTVAIASLAMLFNRAYIPAAATVVGRHSPPERRLQAYSVFQTTFNVGNAVGLALAGYLITHSLTVLLLTDAATSLCFALVALRLPADPAPPPSPGGHDPAPAPVKIRNDVRYLIFCVSVGLFLLVYQQNLGPVPLAVRAHHYSLELLGDLFSANAVAVILFQIPLSSVMRKLPLRVPLALGLALTGCGYLVLLAGFTVPLLITEMAFWTAGEMVYAPAAPTVAAQMSSSRTQGKYQGALDVARSTGQGLGPSLGIFAYAASPSVAWWGAGVLGLAGACMIFVAVRPGRRRPAVSESGEPAASNVPQAASGT
jgi:MFS family permease